MCLLAPSFASFEEVERRLIELRKGGGGFGLLLLGGVCLCVLGTLGCLGGRYRSALVSRPGFAITSSRGVQGEEDEQNDGQFELDGEQGDGHSAVVASLLRKLSRRC